MRYVFVILVLVLLVGCLSPGKRLNIKCHDEVNIYLDGPIYNNGDLCYNDQGKIDFIVMNRDDANIYGFKVDIIGTGTNTNATFRRKMLTGDTMPVTMNVQMSELKEIRRIEVYPIVKMENTTRVCRTARQPYRDIGRCL
ncbi:MAG: hypothetical protein ACQEP1_06420 [Nanobdellota archaeon]